MSPSADPNRCANLDRAVACRVEKIEETRAGSCRMVPTEVKLRVKYPVFVEV